jgi:hypothetical protein
MSPRPEPPNESAAAGPGRGCPVSNTPRSPLPHCGLTVPEVAARYRVSPRKIRAWIRQGALAAVNVGASLAGRPRLVVLPDALAAFERARSATRPPRPPRRRKRTEMVDYYRD